MKIKHLMIVSIMLAVLTIGAVSASEDVIADDSLAADEGVVFEDAPADEVISQDENGEALAITAEDFNANVPVEVNLNEGYSHVVEYTIPEGAEGDICVYVDNNEDYSYSTYIEYENDEDSTNEGSIYLNSIEISEEGTHHILVKYVPYEGDSLTIIEKDINAVRGEYTKESFNFGNPHLNVDIDELDYFMELNNVPHDGTFIVLINGEEKINKNIIDDDFDFYEVTFSELGITSTGTYNVVVKYIIDEKEIVLVDDQLTVSRFYDDDSVRICNEIDLNNLKEYIAEISDDDKIIGTVTLFIDGKQVYSKKFTEADNLKDLTIYNSEIGTGYTYKDYEVKVTYEKDNGDVVSDERTVKFTFVPEVKNPGAMSVGEKESITVTAPKGTSGKITVYSMITKEEEDEDGNKYNTTEREDAVASADIVDGVGTLALDKLAKGVYEFDFNVANYEGYGHSFEIRENSAGITAAVTPTELIVGNNVIVTFNSPKSNEKLYIYLDDAEIKSVLASGSLSEIISTGLTVGQHKIQLYFEDNENNYFYSNTFFVTVKEQPKAPAAPAKKADVISLTLKKVTVKKSAKKLTLQATLKINKKFAKKGTKVTFKFNGKTYKAKVGKKGVAKVTIKKKVLKKLKVGKNIKYQVSYGKKTVKKSVKVKK